MRRFVTLAFPACWLMLVLLLALLPVGFTAQTAAAQASGAALSPKERLNVFNRVWRLVNDRYYDPALNGVNWKAARERYEPRIAAAISDEDFYDLLEQMVAELRDAHTHVRSPFKRSLHDRTQTVSTGIHFYEVEGRNVITSLSPDPEIAKLGIEPGMILLAIDGQPTARRIAEVQELIGVSSSEQARRALTYNNLLDGPPDTQVTLTLEAADKSAPVTVTARRRVISTAPQVNARLLASGFAYIHLSNWKTPAAELFRAALEQFRSAPGLIIDLRDNGGGYPKMVLSVGSLFFSHKTSFGSFTRRSGHPVELTAGHEGTQVYVGPTVILVNESSGSGSELFAAAMQENGRAMIIGQQTCGCVLAADREKLPGGGEITISIFGYLTSRGRRLEGSGVSPDRSVPLRLSDLRQKRDAALLEAEQALKEQLAARPKTAQTMK
jgi:carboxyl-terminal processing protease